jgi:hypothetical protein
LLPEATSALQKPPPEVTSEVLPQEAQPADPMPMEASAEQAEEAPCLAWEDLLKKLAATHGTIRPYLQHTRGCIREGKILVVFQNNKETLMKALLKNGQEETLTRALQELTGFKGPVCYLLEHELAAPAGRNGKEPQEKPGGNTPNHTGKESADGRDKITRLKEMADQAGVQLTLMDG